MKYIQSLTIFFPAYNDGKILPYLIARAYQTAKKITSDFEILIINDGSTDDTVTIVRLLQKHYPMVRLISHKRNQGYGGALRSGFAHAKKQWIFYTDGDGQYDVTELMKLVRYVRPHIDVVNGYKTKRSDPLTRKITGYVYNTLLHLFYSLPIRDIDCDFRLIRATKIHALQLESNSGTICLELVLKLKDTGAHFTEVSVSHYKRTFGSSRFFIPIHLWQHCIDSVRFYRDYKRRTITHSRQRR